MTLRIPAATYRLQFNRESGLNEARALVPYLHALGVTDLYASPLLQAGRGSGHGYDVTDPTRLNRELGGERALAGLTEALRQHDMGLLLDIVPNHMAARAENPWWVDVLRYGPASPYAPYFDINWTPDRPGMTGKVLLPILGSPYGTALENGEFVLALQEDGFWLFYHDRRLPVKPGSYRQILSSGASGCSENPCPGPMPRQLEDLAGELDKLPSHAGTGFMTAFREITGRLWHLYQNCSEARVFIDEALRAINGTRGQPASFDRLDGLLAGQHYRPVFWPVANREINYRRFFGVSELVAVHVEDENVFKATHSLVLRLARAGQVTGLRIDHIDGLYDPEAYLIRLQEQLTGKREGAGFYVVVEKILGPVEELPANWPVHGTSGYDFLNLVNGLFIHSEGLDRLEEIYRCNGGPEDSFEEIVYKMKKRAMAELFSGEMRTLAGQLGRLAEQDRHARDLTLDELAEAVVEVMACFPVYRTYIREFTVTDRERQYIAEAVASAARRNPGAGRACAFLQRVLLQKYTDNLPAEWRLAWLHFVMRWQQFTGPVMAKGVEDAAMYVYNRLVSMNEVGGAPGAPPAPLPEFHRRNRARLQSRAYSLNATSTHDTKRSEDVRMRINVLSEIPALWTGRLEQWRRWNDGHKPVWNGRPVPDGNMEQFIYQTLLGAWPLREDEVPGFKKRLAGYLVKAAREAGTHTNWLQPDGDYEKALVQFTMSILEPGENNLFWPDFIRFQACIAHYGALGSLSQILVKITSPGVPDFYQGTELWDFSLVDPDNRRPVDFNVRMAMLAQLREQESGGRTIPVRELLDSWRDGRVKLFLTYRALQFRRNHPELFAGGEYIPLEASGPGTGHVCAFARRSDGNWVLVAVPRLLALFRAGCRGPAAQGGPPGELPPRILPLGKETWGDSTLLLPEGTPGLWRNVLTGETVAAGAAPGGRVLPLAEVWQSFPAALLAPGDPQAGPLCI
ncbi:malto-oligosyltrehalose synthase [Desulfotomaculum copahuensis]|uniref:Malto-oligosyltrehalose synthase n=1 Tax=Desulfotomaculum copahuensis TaxID=1838280 RepID=A0A1B7LIE4_9FIRM|nr:malto-oligosyltrehalose synthase [Desulfotomaculum copahuensis]OAT86321.1 malto-oligosyltrehalose synthase [Desulfotomaculum copahuensis]